MTARDGGPRNGRDVGAGPSATGVVVGVDGSAASAAAVRWAADWAHERGLPVRLVTAHAVATRSGAVPARLTTELNRLLIRTVAATVARHPELMVAMEISRLSPAAALIELSPHADLIVVGKRGSGGWSSLLLGSVAADVAAHADGVVVVCPQELGHGPRSPVVLGLDGGPGSRETAEFAFRTAAESARGLIAVYVAPDALTLLTGAGGDPEQLMTHPPPEPFDTVLRACGRRYPGVTVEVMTVRGNPAVQLCRIAADAALLVVGSRGRGGFPGLLLGSTSRDVLQATSCPVAVVRPGDLVARGGPHRETVHSCRGWGPVCPGVGV